VIKFIYTGRKGSKNGNVRHTNTDSMLIQKLGKYEGWNFNSGNYLFTTDTK